MHCRDGRFKSVCDAGYMLIHPLSRDTFQQMYPNGRKYLFDLGTGRYLSGSLPWFNSIYSLRGIEFDEVWGELRWPLHCGMHWRPQTWPQPPVEYVCKSICHVTALQCSQHWSFGAAADRFNIYVQLALLVGVWGLCHRQRCLLGCKNTDSDCPARQGGRSSR